MEVWIYFKNPFDGSCGSESEFGCMFSHDRGPSNSGHVANCGKTFLATDKGILSSKYQAVIGCEHLNPFLSNRQTGHPVTQTGHPDRCCDSEVDS